MLPGRFPAPKTVPAHWLGFVGLGLILFSARAQTIDLPGLSLWDRSLNFRAGMGYKDNLLLSRINKERSPFVASGVDGRLLRLPVDGKQVSLLLSAEDLRYWRGKQLDHEQDVIALSQLKLDLDPAWKASLDVQYFYQDQVLDLSTTETNLTTVPVQGHSMSARPSVRRDFGRGFWMEAGTSLTRQFFKEPLDDYWEGGPKLSIGRDYGFKSSVAFSYEFKERSYDRREQLDQSGRRVAGTSLGFRQHALELSLRQNWDTNRHWGTTTKVGLQWNEDNGPGFFDYTKYQLSQQLRYAARPWEIRVQARATYYDFAVQTVSPDDPAKRQKTYLSFSLRGEKKLIRKAKLFAEYEHERAISNRATEEYAANKTVIGIDWEF